MKCISLWPPWAHLLASGQKRMETRSWRPRAALPMVIAIHASSRWNKEALYLCREQPFRKALQAAGYGDHTRPGPNGPWAYDMVSTACLPLGCVIAVGRLCEVIPTDQFGRGLFDNGQLSDQERAFGDYSAGRFAWRFDLMYRLPKPIPLAGSQGLFDWMPPAELLVWAQQALRARQPARPPAPARPPRSTAREREGWEERLEQCGRILEGAAKLPSRADDFRQGVMNNTRDIRKWIKAHEFCTEDQGTALDNMEAGVEAWFR